MPDKSWLSSGVLVPLALGLAGGTAFAGLLLYAVAAPPVLSANAHLALQALAGLCGAWCALRLTRR